MAITLNGSTGITTPADTVTGNATVGGTLTVTGATTVGGVAVVAVAPSTSGNVLTSNGTAWTSAAPSGGGLPTPSAIGQIPFSTNGSTYAATQKIVQGTAQASTSGTSIDFTSIPSWVKRVTVMFNGVSTSGASPIIIQLGTSSGPETTSYSSTGTRTSGGAISTASFTTGFSVDNFAAASYIRFGSTTISLFQASSNAWTYTSLMSDQTVPIQGMGAGYKALAGTLDRVRITTVGGTDTFDAGSINILYE